MEILLLHLKVNLVLLLLLLFGGVVLFYVKSVIEVSSCTSWHQCIAVLDTCATFAGVNC